MPGEVAVRCGECGVGDYHMLTDGSAFAVCLACGHMVSLALDVRPHLEPGETLGRIAGGFLGVIQPPS